MIETESVLIETENGEPKLSVAGRETGGFTGSRGPSKTKRTNRVNRNQSHTD